MDKQRERATVEAFLISQGYAVSCLHEWDREHPDALIRLGDKLVGVEVTTIAEATRRQITPPQMWETEANRIVCAARMAFEARQSTALVVRFELCAAWRPDKSKTRNLANELAAVVEQALTEPPPFLRCGERIILKNPHPDVSWAYIDRTRQDLGGRWAPSFAGGVRCASVDDIRATMARKDPKVGVYIQTGGTRGVALD